jgi:hypothetical protein
VSWSHITVLLDRVDDQRNRDWHAAAAGEHGWSRTVLLSQINCGGSIVQRRWATVGCAAEEVAAVRC